jgi:hypothetical protein
MPIPDRVFLTRLSRSCIRVSGVLLATVTALASPNATMGQESTGRLDPIVIPLLTGEITLDGRVDEPAWEAVPVFPATMHMPNFGLQPTERTEFRVAHDGKYLYASCRAYDSDPAGVRASSLERDLGGYASDWCVLILDTFADKETGLLFGTTPAGLRTDMIFANDTEAGANFNWNTFWDASAHQDDRGWYAEIRIPFTSLRFQRSDIGVVMGISLIRVIARKNEFITFPAISPQWGGFSTFKASQTREVVIQGAQQADPLYITPYGIAGRGHSHTTNDEETGYDRDRDALGEVGLDVKYGITSNLTLDVTANTDFAQAEADNQQVNLTRFSLFFPEKRAFFQERSNVFDYSLGGVERLFHSRRMGLADGERVRIYGGGRLVGRIGDWDVGGLTMQTAASTRGSPSGSFGSSENLGVFRMRRRVLNENSNIGGILTTRTGNASSENVAYGLDALIRVFGEDYLTLNWAQSFDSNVTGSDGFFDRGLARFFWERRGIDGFTYELDLTRSGETFEPGLGFMFRRNYAKGTTKVGYGWRPGIASRIRSSALSVQGTAYRRLEDGSTETAELRPEWVVESKSGHRFTATVRATHEDLDQGFGLPEGTDVPEGEHNFTAGRVQFRQSSSSLFRVTLSGEAGGFFDGRRASGSVTGTWTPSKHFEFEGTYQIEDIRFDKRDQGFRAHILRLSTAARLDTRLSSGALIQYSSAANSLTVNLRLRYNPREGTDLYVVWNEGMVTDRFSFDPVRPWSDRRTLLVKYSQTLTLGL